MRTSILASFLAFTTLSTTLFLDQSLPFALVVLSQDETYNGTTVVPCEKGKQGPFPGLCPLASLTNTIYPIEIFNLNYSSGSIADTTIDTVGYLTYELINRETGTGISNVSAPMAFDNEVSYEVPIFGYAGLDSATKVVFNEDNLLGIPGNLSNTASSANFDATYDKWYVCNIDGGDLVSSYPTAVWSLGDVAPGLASCVKADIIRVFA